MLLSEFKDQVDFLNAHGHGENIVLLTLSESSMGSRASTEVTGIYPGSDWEHGEVRLSTKKKIISYEKDRDNAMQPRRKDYETGSRVRHLLICPKCENHLRKDDNYCSCCGQRINHNKETVPEAFYKPTNGRR